MVESGFGKSSDAKKAMKLHHRDGISLKKAWKEVKSGRKKSPKRKSKGCSANCRCTKCRKAKGSPKQRRAQSKSKKAFNIYWKSKRSPGRSMTLKAAWKKVNKKSRFGAPDGLVWDDKDDLVLGPGDFENPAAASVISNLQSAGLLRRSSSGNVPAPAAFTSRQASAAMAGIPRSVSRQVSNPEAEWARLGTPGHEKGFGDRLYITAHEEAAARALRDEMGLDVFEECPYPEINEYMKETRGADVASKNGQNLYQLDDQDIPKDPANQGLFLNPFYTGEAGTFLAGGRKPCVKKCPRGKNDPNQVFLSRNGGCTKLNERKAVATALRAGLVGDPRVSRANAWDSAPAAMSQRSSKEAVQDLSRNPSAVSGGPTLRQLLSRSGSGSGPRSGSGSGNVPRGLSDIDEFPVALVRGLTASQQSSVTSIRSQASAQEQAARNKRRQGMNDADAAQWSADFKAGASSVRSSSSGGSSSGVSSSGGRPSLNDGTFNIVFNPGMGYYEMKSDLYGVKKVSSAGIAKLTGADAYLYQINPRTGNAVLKCGPGKVRKAGRSAWEPDAKSGCMKDPAVVAAAAALRRVSSGVPSGPGIPTVPPFRMSTKLSAAMSDPGRIEFFKWRAKEAGITTRGTTVKGLQGVLTKNGVEQYASFCVWLSAQGISQDEIVRMIAADRATRGQAARSISSGSGFGKRMSFGACGACRSKKF